MTPGDGALPPTRWSAVAGVRSEDAAERTRSFGALVDAYWKPVYKYVRIRRRASPEEAQDLTQGFFLRALEKSFFTDYDPARARFRTFLRVCLDAYLSNEAKSQSRLKRGGEFAFVSLEFDVAEAELDRSGARLETDVERGFDREWVRGLFEAAVDALRASLTASDRRRALAAFERYDLADPPESRPTYEGLARELGVPVTTVTNDLGSARRELRRIVLEKLRALTASEEEFREEARFVLGHDVTDPDRGGG